MQLKVFLDTTVLLKGFAALRSEQKLPFYLRDSSAERYTFEKCIFESYMAFRGVGGKKPDEGRGRWAEVNLKAKTDPSPIHKLSSKLHGGSSRMAFYWVNQILEAGGRVDNLESYITKYVEPEKQGQAIADVEALRELVSERGKFERLCWDFLDFLKQCDVKVLPYIHVFDMAKSQECMVNACCLDSFVRDTALPSEDFEIVYAALCIDADIFVTDDNRLITCASSLGLNYPLGESQFCKSVDYKNKAQEIREWKEG